MSITQTDRIRIQVRIMELEALSAMNEGDPAFKKMYDSLIDVWKKILNGEFQRIS